METAAYVDESAGRGPIGTTGLTTMAIWPAVVNMSTWSMDLMLAMAAAVKQQRFARGSERRRGKGSE